VSSYNSLRLDDRGKHGSRKADWKVELWKDSPALLNNKLNICGGEAEGWMAMISAWCMHVWKQHIEYHWYIQLMC
jgi:hypothetical protein